MARTRTLEARVPATGRRAAHPSRADRIAAGSTAGRIVAGIAFADPARVAAAGAALVRGGVTVLEVPVPALPGALRVDGAIAGASGVRSPRDAALAKRAGAAFATAPTLNLEVVRACRELGLTFLPGVATPTEIERAAAAGVRVVRVFPAAPLGGSSLLALLADAFPDIGLVPAGAIAPEHVRGYLATASLPAVATSELARPADLRAGRYARIEAAARRASSAGPQ